MILAEQIEKDYGNLMLLKMCCEQNGIGNLYYKERERLQKKYFPNNSTDINDKGNQNVHLIPTNGNNNISTDSPFYENKLFDVSPKKIIKPKIGIAVDVGTKGNPGICEYRGVDIATGKEVFSVKIPGISTNNIGEWLALVDGIDFIKTNKLSIPVYTDSMTALSWYKNKKCKTKFIIDNDQQKLMIIQAEKYLRTVSHGVNVLLWNTKLFGENISDYGRK